jgi:phosphoribosylanthranilate isomerase
MFVKICGLSTSQDVATAVAAGADAIGFVLTDSPRQVDPCRARILARSIPDTVLTVGVFGPTPVEQVRRAAGSSGLSAIQLHGSQPRAAFDAVADLGLILIRATSTGDARGAKVGDYGEHMLILDSASPGSGRSWFESVDDYRLPAGRWLLAGGLDPFNVAHAIAACQPWGVDVSSGVECSRGVKDGALIRRFIDNVRQRERPPSHHGP